MQGTFYYGYIVSKKGHTINILQIKLKTKLIMLLNHFLKSSCLNYRKLEVQFGCTLKIAKTRRSLNSAELKNLIFPNVTVIHGKALGGVLVFT